MGHSAESRPWQPFLDRDDAGARLARKLHRFRGWDNAVVLGLARGGVPIGAAVARGLGLPLGVMVVRKLGVPGAPEVAFGAVATYGGFTTTVHLAATMEHLRRAGFAIGELDEVDQAERAELARRQDLYVRGAQPPVVGRTVLLCDDGLATGATMRAAVGLMREAGAGVVLVCVPTAPARTCEELAAVADQMVCLQPWPDLHAVSEAYLRFDQIADAQVLELLANP
ncbi:phosphoribosyltransferase [Specibacter sp. RAF43]|uniref:phosphoribosyltransferase n=1 Tax=Specibacter sp. RAF43 TaxID=3233057 RepID=UPI003F9CD5D5